MYNAERAISEWVEQALEEEERAIEHLEYYLESDGTSKHYERFQNIIDNLQQRNQIVHFLLETSIERDEVVSMEVSRDITLDRQHAAVFILRTLKNYDPIQNVRSSWSKIAADVNKLEHLASRIHEVKQQDVKTADSLMLLANQLQTFRKATGKHQNALLTNTNQLIDWLEQIIWWIAYILLALLFVGCMITIVIRNRISESKDQELSSLFENTPLAIALLDEKANVRRVNPAFTNLFGYSEGELRNHHIDRFIVPEGKRHEARKFNMESLAKQTVTEKTQRTDKNGNTIHVAVSAFPIEVNGKHTGIYAIYQDITEIVRMNNQLEQSVQDKQTLLEEIHHRVKNNLAVISGLLYLKAETTEDERLGESLKEAQNRIQSMALIHEQLYQEAEENARIDMQKYLPDLIDNIEQSYNDIEAEIETEVTAEDIKLPLKRSVTIGLLTTELVNNAFKHGFTGRDKGWIHVEMQRENGNIRLTVSDNGVGLPEDFDLYKGSMGMQLLNNLTNQLEGEVEFDSKAEKGTCFMVTFEEDSEESKIKL